MRLSLCSMKLYLIRAIISLGFIDNQIFSFHVLTKLILKLYFRHIKLEIPNKIASVFQHLQHSFSDSKEFGDFFFWEHHLFQPKHIFKKFSIQSLFSIRCT